MTQTFSKAFYVQGPPENASVFGAVWKSGHNWVVSWTFHYEGFPNSGWTHLAETSEEAVTVHLRTLWNLFLQSRQNLGFNSCAQHDRMEEIQQHPQTLPWGSPFQSFPTALDDESDVRQGAAFRPQQVLQN